MRSIVGVQKVESGTVTVLGDPAGTAPQRRRVAYDTQAASVYGDLTVSQNLALLRAAHRRAALRRRSRDRRRSGSRATPTRPSTSLSGGRRAACRSPSRCSARPNSSSSTSPPSGSIRCCAPSCGTLFRALADGGATLIVVEPRHGRGAALRPARAHARRPDHRRHDTRRPARRHRNDGSGCRVPRPRRSAMRPLPQRRSPPTDAVAPVSDPTATELPDGDEPEHPLTRRELRESHEQHRRRRHQTRHPDRAKPRPADEPHVHLRDRRPRAAAAEPRSALDRPHARGARACWSGCSPGCSASRRASSTSTAAPILGALPVHRDVPHHLDHDPARTPLGNPRATHDDAARQGRLHRGLRARVRPDGDCCRRRSLSRSRCGSAVSTCEGEVWQLGLVAVVDAMLGMALGLLASAFARTEFQAVQFMPLIVFPQILLGGLFMPRDQMPDALYIDLEVPAAELRDRRDQRRDGRGRGLGRLGAAAGRGRRSRLGSLILASLTLRRAHPAVAVPVSSRAAACAASR